MADNLTPTDNSSGTSNEQASQQNPNQPTEMADNTTPTGNVSGSTTNTSNETVSKQSSNTVLQYMYDKHGVSNYDSIIMVSDDTDPETKLKSGS